MHWRIASISLYDPVTCRILVDQGQPVDEQRRHQVEHWQKPSSLREQLNFTDMTFLLDSSTK